MIEGTYSSEFRQAVVDLTVRGPAGDEVQLEFVVDTGFNADLILHSSVAAALGVHVEGMERAMLADGSVISFPMGRAQLHWNGTLRHVNVGIADIVSHVGMQVLDGHELRIQAVPDGAVQITPLLGTAS